MTETTATIDTYLEAYGEPDTGRRRELDEHHGTARYSWDLVAPDGSVALSGIDIASFDEAGGWRASPGSSVHFLTSTREPENRTRRVGSPHEPALGSGARYRRRMPDPTYRDATVDDLPVIVAMYADDELGRTREQPSEPLAGEYLEAFRQIDADPRHRLVVAEVDDEVVGTLQLSFLPHLVLLGGERAQIEAVRVRSDRRGSGLGEALFEWAIDQARRRGCRLIQLTTNAARDEAHRFYERLGFRPTHVGMKLDLTDR